MARYKSYDYTQTVLVPVSFETQLLPGTLEYAIQVLVERRVDTASFSSQYKNEATGCPAYDPKILLKVILLAYARGIISSRKIEQACRENVTFMALAEFEKLLGAGTLRTHGYLPTLSTTCDQTRWL